MLKDKDPTRTIQQYNLNINAKNSSDDEEG